MRRVTIRSYRIHLTLTHALILLLYFLSISFVFSAAVIQSGLGLATRATCHSAVLICLAFYIGSKATMQVKPHAVDSY